MAGRRLPPAQPKQPSTTTTTTTTSSSPFSSWRWFSCSKPKSRSLRAAAPPLPSIADSAEETAVMNGLRSDRLFFDVFCGGECSSSMVAGGSADAIGAAVAEAEGFYGGVAVEVDSRDPYSDFRASMEEMMETRGGAMDWAWLQEMVAWFLRANSKGTHSSIVAAFLDLLLAFAASSYALEIQQAVVHRNGPP